MVRQSDDRARPLRHPRRLASLPNNYEASRHAYHHTNYNYIRGGEPAARAALERTFPDRDWSSGKEFSVKAKAAGLQIIAALIAGGFTNIQLSLGDHDE